MQWSVVVSNECFHETKWIKDFTELDFLLILMLYIQESKVGKDLPRNLSLCEGSKVKLSPPVSSFFNFARLLAYPTSAYIPGDKAWLL